MKLAKYREIAQKIEALILNTDKRVAEIQGAEMYAQDYKDQQIGKIKEQAKAEMEALLSSLKTQYQEDQKDLKFPYSEDYAKRQYEAVAVEQELRGLNAHQVLEWYQEMAREGDPIKRGEADRLILARLNREAPGLLSDFKRIRVKSLNPDETKFEATKAALGSIKYGLEVLRGTASAQFDRVLSGEYRDNEEVTRGVFQISGVVSHIEEQASKAMGEFGADLDNE